MQTLMVYLLLWCKVITLRAATKTKMKRKAAADQPSCLSYLDKRDVVYIINNEAEKPKRGTQEAIGFKMCQYSSK